MCTNPKIFNRLFSKFRQISFKFRKFDFIYFSCSNKINFSWERYIYIYVRLGIKIFSSATFKSYFTKKLQALPFKQGITRSTQCQQRDARFVYPSHVISYIHCPYNSLTWSKSRVISWLLDEIHYIQVLLEIIFKGQIKNIQKLFTNNGPIFMTGLAFVPVRSF